MLAHADETVIPILTIMLGSGFAAGFGLALWGLLRNRSDRDK